MNPLRSSGLTDDGLDRYFRATDCNPDIGPLPDSVVRPIRRLLWAKLLNAVTGSSLEEWATQLDDQRAQYKELKDAHRRENDIKKADPSICNPLSKSQDNPLLKLQASKDLLEEIWKDIERTYSEMEMFQNDKVRKCMQQVLFHWCKACNPASDPSESYRQGMNELVALCMYVVLQGQYGGSSPDGLCGRLVSESHNEGDLFILFSALMEFGGLSTMFEVVKAKPSKPGLDLGESSLTGRGRSAPQQTRSAILARCDHIYNTILKKLDGPLHSFLINKGVEPQIFMLRWLRLMFCREFSVDDTLVLWTHIFVDSQQPLPDNPLLKYNRKPGKGSEGVAVAEASSMALPLVDFFAVAMIMYLKSQLLEEDDNCLTVLMRPEFHNVNKLVELARQFRSGSGSTSAAPTPAVAVSKPAPVQPKATTHPLDTSYPSQTPPAVSRETSPAKHATASDFVAARDFPDGSLATQLADLRRKVEKLEQEKVAIATKGREFIAKKTAEFNAKVAELESRAAVDRGTEEGSGTEVLNSRIAELESALANSLENMQVKEGDLNEIRNEVETQRRIAQVNENEKMAALAQLASATEKLAIIATASEVAEKEKSAALAELASQSEKLAAADNEVAELKRVLSKAAATQEAVETLPETMDER